MKELKNLWIEEHFYSVQEILCAHYFDRLLK